MDVRERLLTMFTHSCNSTEDRRYCTNLQCMSGRLQAAQLGAGFVETANEAYEHVVALAAALHKAKVNTKYESSEHILRWGTEEFSRMHDKQDNWFEGVTQRVQNLFSRGPYSGRFLQMTAYTRVLVFEAWNYGINLRCIQVPKDTVRWAREVHSRHAAMAPFGTWPVLVTDEAHGENMESSSFMGLRSSY